METQKKGRSTTFWVVLFVVAGLVAVPCMIGVVGIAAAVAIPAFHGYLTRSKTAEADANLRNLYSSAAAHYAEAGCTVPSAITSNTPDGTMTVVDQLPESFATLGVQFADPIRYQYEIVSAGGCGHPADSAVYTFRARGDLDGDGEQSLFELTATSDGQNGLVRAPELRVENELE